MARGLDHVVHAVQDLEAAGALYRRLGFLVGARNRHPWGTHNRLVQLPGFFLEILAIADAAAIPPSTPKSFSFGAFNRDFLASVGGGLSCMVVEGTDPAGEKAAIDRAGFGGFDLLSFSRDGKRADGTDTVVGFSIAFARDPASPHAAFFTCKQTRPENFWSRELQRHENGAEAIGACALVADNPTDHHVFIEAIAGVRDLHASSRGLTVHTPRGDILVLDPRSFRETFGFDAPRDAGLRVGALIFKVADIDRARVLLERAGLEPRAHRARLVVGPDAAFGAVIAFEAS